MLAQCRRFNVESIGGIGIDRDFRVKLADRAGQRHDLNNGWAGVENSLCCDHDRRMAEPCFAASEGTSVAAMLETFDPVGRVIQVRIVGPASIETFDVDRVHQIYDRYLAANDLWTKQWRTQASDPSFVLWTIGPASGAAVQYPKLNDAGGVFRWSSPEAFVHAMDEFDEQADTTLR